MCILTNRLNNRSSYCTSDLEPFNLNQNQSNPTVKVYAWLASWCGHCQKFKSTLEMIKQKYANDKNVQIIEYDCSHDVPPHNTGIKVMGFPTIAIGKNDEAPTVLIDRNSLDKKIEEQLNS